MFCKLKIKKKILGAYIYIPCERDKVTVTLKFSGSVTIKVAVSKTSVKKFWQRWKSHKCWLTKALIRTPNQEECLHTGTWTQMRD